MPAPQWLVAPSQGHAADEEKDFIRPLTPAQVIELRKNVQMVNCSNCGAPVDLTTSAACRHCGAPLSMLDMEQAEKLVELLRQADTPAHLVDPALPLELARARAKVDAAFVGLRDNSFLLDDISANGLVAAGLRTLARWLETDSE